MDEKKITNKLTYFIQYGGNECDPVYDCQHLQYLIATYGIS